MTTPTPARVSGPGQYSQRTDNGQPLRDLPDAKYGEAKALMDQQRAAPLANGPDRPTPSPSGLGSMPAGPGGEPQTVARMAELTPLSAPTARPGEHVTTGMQSGEQGPRQRPELKANQLSDALRPYFAADTTGVLADFAWQLADMGL